MPSAYYRANYNKHGVRFGRCTCQITETVTKDGSESVWQRASTCLRHLTIDDLLDDAGIAIDR